MTLLAGVDAGASHTEVVLARADLEPIARRSGAPGALVPGTVPAAARIIAELVRAALSDAGITATLDAVAVGAAGAGLEANRSGLQAALEEEGLAQRVLVTTDGHIALHSAFGDEPGIVLSAGTGSIGLARDPSGRLHRTGGHGWQYGDEGSGYALARAALSAAAKAHDGRGPATSLIESLPLEARQPDVASMLAWARTAGVPQVAALATVVLDAARTGDAVASGLVTHSARELAAHIRALLASFPKERGAAIAFSGSLLAEGSPVRRALISALEPDSGRILLTDVRVDPAMGAVELAGELVR